MAEPKRLDGTGGRRASTPLPGQEHDGERYPCLILSPVRYLGRKVNPAVGDGVAGKDDIQRHVHRPSDHRLPNTLAAMQRSTGTGESRVAQHSSV